MTRLLKQAFEAASVLPSDDQDALTSRLLQEVAWEKKWDSAFSENPEKLKRLVDEALQDIKAGRVRELNPDDL